MQDIKPENIQPKTSTPSSNTKPKITPLNWVTARVWRAVIRNEQNQTVEYVDPKIAANNTHRGGLVGHATVQTSTIYASFWPAEPYNPNLKTPVRAVHAPNPEKDIEGEHRLPEAEITFYSLDREKIDSEFQKFEEERTAPGGMLTKTSGWNAKGAGWFNGNRGENCSGLSYRLLRAGGINELSPKCKSLNSIQTLYITPNDLFECVNDAKIKELALYPETREFKPQRKI